MKRITFDIQFFAGKSVLNELRKNPNFRDTEYFEINFSVDKINEDDRTVELSITSETIAQRWFGSLVLGHNPGECRLERTFKVGSFLFAHGRDPVYGLMPIGPILDVWLDESKSPKQYRARLKFDEDEKSDLLFQKVKSGALKGVSVGVRFYKLMFVDEGQEERGFKGPVYVATDWDIVEISLEPTPELIVGVGLSAAETGAGNGTHSDIFNKEAMKGMRKFKVIRNGVEVEVIESELTSEERIQLLETNQQTEPVAGILPQNQPVAGINLSSQDQPSADDLTAAERNRQREIRAACARFGISQEDMERFLNDGSTIQDVNNFVLERLATSHRPVPVAHITVDERDKFRLAAIDGLAMRANSEIRIDKPAPGATELRNLSLIELAQECAERATGQSFRRADKETIIRAALGLDEYGRFMGTSDFPGILSNVANKSLSTAYEAAETTYQYWTRRGNLSDFKTAHRYTLSHADDLKKIEQSGEFVNSTFTEQGRQIQLGTYGRKWGLTRQAIINDDLDALSVLPTRFAIAARRLINKTVYNILNSNQTIDNKELFCADHKNLGTGAALSVESLGKAKAAMAKQKDIGNKQTLNIRAAFLLTPEELAVAAQQLVASTVDPSKNNAVPNPEFIRRLTPISDPELDEGSITAWYLAGAPGVTDTIEVAFLNGRDLPNIESQVSFDILGIQWRIYIDFGVALLDWRALYKNPGVAAG